MEILTARVVPARQAKQLPSFDRLANFDMSFDEMRIEGLKLRLVVQLNVEPVEHRHPAHAENDAVRDGNYRSAGRDIEIDSGMAPITVANTAHAIGTVRGFRVGRPVGGMCRAGGQQKSTHHRADDPVFHLPDIPDEPRRSRRCGRPRQSDAISSREPFEPITAERSS